MVGVVGRMTDLEILNQLLNGNHLNVLEIERAKQLLFNLKSELERRI